MCTLPPEILEIILSLALFSTNTDDCDSAKVSPTSILLTSSTFRAIGEQLLYGRLIFRSTRQLHAFLAYYQLAPSYSLAERSGLIERGKDIRIPSRPRTVELNISDVDASTRMFLHMRELFRRLISLSPGDGHIDTPTALEGKLTGGTEYTRLALDTLRLGFNSHIKDEGLDMIEDALAFVNPERFIWTGPDSLPHHFSIAIVPRAIPPLFIALSKFMRLRELTLTHIALVSVPSDTAPFPLLPTLETLCLHQATFVEPWRMVEVILGLAGISPHPRIREVRLVDVYIQSIWGPRLRRTDLEAAAAASLNATQSPPTTSTSSELSESRGVMLVDSMDIECAKETIRSIVKCQAKTERKYGGDRALDSMAELL